MSRRTFRLAACVAAVSWLAGCASVSIDEAVQETNQAAPGFTQGQLTLARSDEQRQARADAAQQLLAKPLSMDDAVRLALANSPALQALVAQSKATLDRLYRAAGDAEPGEVDAAFVDALSDDLNTPLALSRLAAIEDPAALKASAQLLGLLTASPGEWFQGAGDSGDIEARIEARAEAKKNRDFAEADRIRDELKAEGILLEDGSSGTTWRRE